MSEVHPARREVLPGDPMELHAVEIPGDADRLLRVLVEEYARMGWDEEAILGLARRPFFRGFHEFLRRHGEAELRRRVRGILARTGVTRVRVERAANPGDSNPGGDPAWHA